MKFKLIFGRTEYDPETAWTALKEVIVDVPDYLFSKSGFGEYHLIGGYLVEETSGGTE